MNYGLSTTTCGTQSSPNRCANQQARAWLCHRGKSASVAFERVRELGWRSDAKRSGVERHFCYTLSGRHGLCVAVPLRIARSPRLIRNTVPAVHKRPRAASRLLFIIRI